MNKKHIVFILGNYYPDYSANGICVKKLVDDIKHEQNVTVICKKTNNEQVDIERFDLQTIIRISNMEISARNKIDEILRNSDNKCKKLLSICLLRIIQIRGYLRAIFFRENINKSFIKRYVNALHKIEQPIDLIVPVCFPYESIVAALKYKEMYNINQKIVPYLLDKYSSANGLHRTEWNKKWKWERHLSMEKEMLDKSEHVIASVDWEEHMNCYLNNNINKVTFVEIPALCPIEKDNLVKYEDEKINIVYTGALNHKIRPVEYTLKLFYGFIKNNEKYVLHLYSRGNCNNIINKYVSIKPKQFINHGSVTVNVAYSAMNNSNFLLSVGNTDLTQQPSKIYEYMSCGKPIIHLYHDERDPMIQVLSKYPMSCCLKQSVDCFINNACDIEAFIKKYYKKPIVSYDIVETIFKKSTPKYVIKVLNSCLKT